MKTASPLSGKLLLTTALTAVGMIAIGGTARADNWTDHQATVGSITIDTSLPSTTNITQHDHFVKVQGDGDINAGWTVNVAQPSTAAKYVLYDIENDPTHIMGALNANGEIYIFDGNGVIFGKDSRVDVGSIVASTGFVADESILSGRLAFENVAGAPGGAIAIEQGATISVADAGLAAFVAPTVTNAGIINARLGKVVMASAERVTLDFYGDGLIEVSPDGELADGLIENAGTINAQGGQVVMTASAAKQAVDNVINMSGVVNASSASVRGGKIVLSGGGKGKVSVSGKMDASGAAGGGSIGVTGETVDIAAGSELTAHGANGEIKIVANGFGRFAGILTALGDDSFIETSAATLAFEDTATVLAAHWLVDPTDITIDGVLAGLLETQLDAGGDATVETDIGGTDAGHIFVDADISWSGLGNLILNAVGSIFHNADVTAAYNGGDATKGGVRYIAGGAIAIGSGDTIQTASGAIDLNQNGVFSTVNTNSIRTSGGTVSLRQNSGGSIQNAINAIDNTGAGRNTITVGAGTYNEAVRIQEANFTLKGANAGIDPNTGTRGAESIIVPNSPGILITADNAVVDGFEIVGGEQGVRVTNADNTEIRNNFIHDQTLNGVRADLENTDSIVVSRNRIRDTGDDGIRIVGGSDSSLVRNDIRFAGERGIDLREASTYVISRNTIQDTADDGIYAADIAGIQILDNVVRRAGTGDPAGDGIDVNRGSDVLVRGNTVNTVADDGIDVVDALNVKIRNNWVLNAADFGIDSLRNTETVITGNRIADSGDTGIHATGSDEALIMDNVVRNAGAHGILASGFATAKIIINDIWSAALDGIHLESFGDGFITGNKVFTTGDDGVETVGGSFVSLYYNIINGAGFFNGGLNADVSGADGIRVSNVVTLGDSGFDVDIFGNVVSRTYDDGIEVVGSGTTWIAANGVFNAGYGGGGYYGGGDPVYGADGIHVRNVWDLESGGTPWAVMVLGNFVDTAGDDGIQVLYSGDTLVGGNTVDDAGSASGARIFGGDGINIVTGSPFLNPGSSFYDLFGYYFTGPAPVTVHVLGNTVDNSLDDGIQVVGATDVLIDGNLSVNSGDDGINILGFSAVTKSGGWPAFNAVVTGNGVGVSGGDGIQSEGFGTLLVDGNGVFGSAANGLFVSGFNNGVSTVSGNFFGGNDIGAQFESGLVDLTGDGNTFIGGRVGLRFAPHDFAAGPSDPSVERFVYNLFFPYPFATPGSGFAALSLVDDDAPGADTLGGTFPPANFGGTIGAQLFDGQSEYFVELANNAFFAPGFPTILNGLDSTYVTPFGTVTPADTGGIISAPVLGFLEGRFQHHPDTLDLGLFWFGLARDPEDPTDPTDPIDPAEPLAEQADLDQEDFFREYSFPQFNLTTASFTITGLPRIPGGPNNLNNIATFAGGNGGTAPTGPAALNAIQPAAGGQPGDEGAATQPQQLNAIETAAGEEVNCWGEAIDATYTGRAATFSYGSGFEDVVQDASNCQSQF